MFLLVLFYVCNHKEGTPYRLQLDNKTTAQATKTGLKLYNLLPLKFERKKRINFFDEFFFIKPQHPNFAHL